MIDMGDGTFQARIDLGQCPRCETSIDYSTEIVVCRTCNLTMSGAGIQKHKDPNQLELPLWPMGEHHGTEEKDKVREGS